MSKKSYHETYGFLDDVGKMGFKDGWQVICEVMMKMLPVIYCINRGTDDYRLSGFMDNDRFHWRWFLTGIACI